MPSAATWLLAPIAGGALFAVWCAWSALGIALDPSSSLAMPLSLSVLVGLAASSRGSLSGSGSGGDATVVSALALATCAACALAARGGEGGLARCVRGRSGRAAGAACLLGAASYAASLLAGPSLLQGSRARANATLALLLPLLELARGLRLWRHASRAGLLEAERRVLSAALGSRASLTQGDAGGLHFVRVERAGGGGGGGRVPLVILHGYMAGPSLFLYQLAELAEEFSCVYAVDWPGCGASPRLPYAARGPAAAEAWLLAHLNAWREATPELAGGWVLLGHSLGGYIGAAWALQLSGAGAGAGGAGGGRAQPLPPRALLLVSPAGVPSGAVVDPTAPRGGMVPAPPPGAPPRPPIPPLLWRAAIAAWESGFTPGVGLRWLGPLAPAVAAGGLARRAERWVLERPLTPFLPGLAQFFYHSIAQDGSGEHVLRDLLAPGVRARGPHLRARLAQAARGGAGGEGASATHAPFRMPTAFVYGGSHDWMEASHGEDAAADMRAAGTWAECHVVSPGGHHMYLESPTAFNKLITELAGAKGRMYC